MRLNYFITHKMIRILFDSVRNKRNHALAKNNPQSQDFGIFRYMDNEPIEE